MAQKRPGDSRFHGLGDKGRGLYRVEGLGFTQAPEQRSNIPQIPTLKGHKDSIKGPLTGPGKVGV